MPTPCNNYIVPVFEEDLCSGETKPATCVIDSSLYSELGLESNSSQQEINQAIYVAYLNLKATSDAQNTSILQLNGSETKIEAGDNLLVTGVGTEGTPYVISSPTNLEEDFFIATQIASSKLIYHTNTYKEIDLQPYTDIVITNTNEIIRDGNNLYVVGNYSSNNSLPAFILKIVDCKISNNTLVFDYIEAVGLNSPSHSLIMHNKFLFSCTRTALTEIVKINPYDFSDIKTLVLPNTVDFNGSTNEILSYKDSLYVLVTTGYYQSSKLIEINENLLQYTKLFTIPSVTEYLTAPSSPFIIYKEEVYIPFLVSPTQISIRVYDLQGNIKRSATNIPIIGLGTNIALAHWISIFNNKIIITTNYTKSIIRLDCLTLSLEETVAIASPITDDNTITKEGYMYLNGEKSSNDIGTAVELYKIKYNDFTDKTIEILNYNNGNGSYGSINSKIY